MNINYNLKRINSLIKQGDTLLKSKRRPLYKLGFEVDNVQSQQWGTSCLNVISNAIGTDNEFYKNYRIFYESFPNYDFTEKAFGVLKSFKEYIEFNVKAKRERILLSSKVFSDLIEQAEYLVKSEFFIPAIMILGVVMESLLKNAKEIELEEKNRKLGLSALNDLLHKKEVYDSLLFRKISLSIELRNKVVHGKFEGIEIEDYSDMLKTIKKIKTILES